MQEDDHVPRGAGGEGVSSGEKPPVFGVPREPMAPPPPSVPVSPPPPQQPPPPAGSEPVVPAYRPGPAPIASSPRPSYLQRKAKIWAFIFAVLAPIGVVAFVIDNWPANESERLLNRARSSPEVEVFPIQLPGEGEGVIDVGQTISGNPVLENIFSQDPFGLTDDVRADARSSCWGLSEGGVLSEVTVVVWESDVEFGDAEEFFDGDIANRASYYERMVSVYCPQFN